MNTLDRFFKQAANRPLAFSEDRIRQMLSAHDTAPVHFDDLTRPRFSYRAGRLTVLGLAIAVGAGLFFSSTAPVRVADASSSPGSVTTGARANPQATAPTDAGALPGDVNGTPTAGTPGAAAAAPAARFATVAASTTIDLLESETAAVGLRRLPDGRTAFAYYLVSADGRPSSENLNRRLARSGYSDSLLVRTISSDGLRDVRISRAAFPLGIVTRRASPLAAAWQIVTDANGRLLDNRIRPASAVQLRAITGLFARGASISPARVDSLIGIDALGRELRLNTLLPIRIGTGASDHPDAIFWCAAEPELLAALPARAIERLRAELETTASSVATADTVALVRRGWALGVLRTLDSLRPQQVALDNGLELAAVDKLTGGGIIGGSRRQAGAVARFVPASIVARGSVQLTLALTQPRSVTVTLHTISGERVRTLVTTDLLQEGTSALTVSTAGVPRGMYLLALGTDKGEQVVQRVVVE